MRPELHKLIMELEPEQKEREIEAIESWLWAIDDLQYLSSTNHLLAVVEIKKHFATREKQIMRLKKLDLPVNATSMIEEYNRMKSLLYVKQAKLRLEASTKEEVSIFNLL